MNREIKFRIWSESDKEMTLHEDIRILPDDKMLSDMFDDNSVVWMQFTGRIDKNGVEIYEGSIVKRTYVKWIDDNDNEYIKEITKVSVVEYREHGFWIKDEEFGWEGEGLWNWDMVEVVGNIYDNPELLTE